MIEIIKPVIAWQQNLNGNAPYISFLFLWGGKIRLVQMFSKLSIEKLQFLNILNTKIILNNGIDYLKLFKTSATFPRFINLLYLYF